MIIITNEPHKVADWIETNCEEPSAYTLGRAWLSDTLLHSAGPSPTEVVIELTPVDQMLFDLMFAGSFVRNPRNDRWYDNTGINRIMIEVQNP